MSKGKCLIVGGSGFIGAHLARALQADFDVVSTFRARADRVPAGFPCMSLDLTEPEQLEAVWRRAAPDIVVHAAGLKNPAYCEAHREEAWAVNVEGTRHLSLACRTTHSRLIYLSTDYVFAGTAGLYSETDEAEPVTWYGQTKLAAERVLTEAGVEAAVCRSSAVYGEGATFAAWLLGELERGVPVDVFEDSFNSPTYVGNLADMIRTILERRLQGTFHTAGAERSSRYAFAVRLAQELGYDAGLVRPATRQGQAQKLFIPPDCSLSVAWSQQALGMPFLDVESGLRAWKLEREESAR